MSGYNSFIADETIIKNNNIVKEKDYFTIVPCNTLVVELSRILTKSLHAVALVGLWETFHKPMIFTQTNGPK
jgi:hypothetical protein